MARRVLLALATGVAIAFLLAFVVPFFAPWTVLNCETNSIDINSGRVKHEAWLLGVKWSDGESETDLSRMYRELLGAPPAPDWHPVTTFSPGLRNSPHYIYHGALHDAGRLIEAFRLTAFSDEARRRAIVTLLDLWKKDGNDYRAGLYVIEVLNRVLTRRKTPDSPPFKPDELPDPDALENR